VRGTSHSRPDVNQPPMADDPIYPVIMLLGATVPTTIAGCVALLAYLDELARDADASTCGPPARVRCRKAGMGWAWQESLRRPYPRSL
jgi:hypothetical protein